MDNYNNLFEESFFKKPKKIKRVIQPDMNSLSSKSTTTVSSSTSQPENSAVASTYNDISIYKGSSGQYYFFKKNGKKSFWNSIIGAKMGITDEYPENSKPRRRRILNVTSIDTENNATSNDGEYSEMTAKDIEKTHESLTDNLKVFFRKDNPWMWGGIAGIFIVIGLVIYFSTKKKK